MADEIRRVEEVDDRPRDTVVVQDRKRSSAGLIILGIIVIILLVFYLWGNPFAGRDVDVNPDVNVPSVDVDATRPDVDVDGQRPNVDVDPPADETPQ